MKAERERFVAHKRDLDAQQQRMVDRRWRIPNAPVKFTRESILTAWNRESLAKHMKKDLEAWKASTRDESAHPASSLYEDGHLPKVLANLTAEYLQPSVSFDQEATKVRVPTSLSDCIVLPCSKEIVLILDPEHRDVMVVDRSNAANPVVNTAALHHEPQTAAYDPATRMLYTWSPSDTAEGVLYISKYRLRHETGQANETPILSFIGTCPVQATGSLLRHPIEAFSTMTFDTKRNLLWACSRESSKGRCVTLRPISTGSTGSASVNWSIDEFDGPIAFVMEDANLVLPARARSIQVEPVRGNQLSISTHWPSTKLVTLSSDERPTVVSEADIFGDESKWPAWLVALETYTEVPRTKTWLVYGDMLLAHDPISGRVAEVDLGTQRVLNHYHTGLYQTDETDYRIAPFVYDPFTHSVLLLVQRHLFAFPIHRNRAQGPRRPAPSSSSSTSMSSQPEETKTRSSSSSSSSSLSSASTSLSLAPSASSSSAASTSSVSGSSIGMSDERLQPRARG